MNIYWNSFRTFFRIGLFTIGGGYAMIPLIEADVVDKNKWVAREDFLDLMAIAQSCPGIFAVNMSIFIGYKLKGVPGSVVCALGTILPSFLIILGIALFFQQFRDNETVQRIFKGIRPAVVALIAAPTFKMGKSANRDDQCVHTCGECLVDLAVGCFSYIHYYNGRLGRLPVRALYQTV